MAHHYVYFCMEREAIPRSPFLHVKAFEGAQVTYAWKQLETGKGCYDFSLIREDLKFLTAR
ncbi:MAG: hypothetical protein RDV48_26230 [Candidatus Eremiobacteraeota bacterium]|nr:hypothetical protein [Candidatus Eremiobacteraeota bacterium]